LRQLFPAQTRRPASSPVRQAYLGGCQALAAAAKKACQLRAPLRIMPFPLLMHDASCLPFVVAPAPASMPAG
jgi:hypothetical protein